MPNPYAIIGGLVGVILLVTGAFFYGQHIGRQGERSDQLVAVKDQFRGFITDAGLAAQAGTTAALGDFNARTAALGRVAENLRRTQGIMDNAANQLSESLRGGGCFLSPVQRRLLECVRRPGDAACAAPGP